MRSVFYFTQFEISRKDSLFNLKLFSISLFRLYSFIMEEHGMFVEKTVEEDERNQHERCLRMAIKVTKIIYLN